PHVGNGKTVTFAGYTISGADAGNYALSQPANSTANITAKPLTVTADAQSATYGDTLQALTYSTAGLVGGDSLTGALTVTGVGNAGTVLKDANGVDVSGSPFTISQGTLANSDYSITYNPASLTLSAKGLTITGFAAANKVYDGLTTATIT